MDLYKYHKQALKHSDIAHDHVASLAIHRTIGPMITGKIKFNESKFYNACDLIFAKGTPCEAYELARELLDALRSYRLPEFINKKRLFKKADVAVDNARKFLMDHKDNIVIPDDVIGDIWCAEELRHLLIPNPGDDE